MVHSHHTLGRVKNRWLAPGDSPEPPLRLAGEDEVIAASDVLVASTEEEQRQLADLYGAAPERLKILHPGVDHSLFSPGDRAQAREILGLPGAPLLVAVGRVQRLKGFDLAVEALADPSLPASTRLVIVGGAGGPQGEAEAARLETIAAERGVSERIIWSGVQPHRMLPLYYRAADVLLVCSHSESFGLAALEAQSCGIPVVGTAVGGLPQVIADGRSGILLHERDPGRMATEVSHLLRDADRASLFGTRAREQALLFSWKTMAEDFLTLYECLIRSESPEACTC